jgi:hypothetical protein
MEDDRYYWTNRGMEVAVTRFPDIATAKALVQTRKEFNQISNTGTDIILPELLYHMEIPTIRIDEVVYFEPADTLDFTTILTQYKSRKLAFDAKLKELDAI